MKLYIMRHGQAETVAQSDKERRLSKTGSVETEAVAKWLAQQKPQFSLSFVSPYVRTLETYQLVSEQIEQVANHYVLEELTPESDPASCGDSLLAYCAEHKASSALVVSHLPLVGLLIADLCPGVVLPIFVPSSIACLDIDLDNWQGKLLWYKTYQHIALEQTG
jgi:phosphohistidine phosphatase